MAEEGQNFIIVLIVGLSKVDVDLPHNRVEVAILIEHQVAVHVDIKVLNLKLDITFMREDIRVDNLMCTDNPFFDGREVKLN